MSLRHTTFLHNVSTHTCVRRTRDESSCPLQRVAAVVQESVLVCVPTHKGGSWRQTYTFSYKIFQTALGASRREAAMAKEDLATERRDRATEKEALVRPCPILVGKNEVSFGGW